MNRTADAKPHENQIVLWDPAYDGCGCSDENRQIANLLALHEEYANALDYDLFPSFQNSYNSNSYTSGLLDAAGIYKIRPPVSTPGWNDPLPPEYFGK